MKKNVRKGKLHKIKTIIKTVTVVTTIVGAVRGWAIHEMMKLAFTTKPSLLGKKMMENPLFFTPKEHIHWLAEQPMEELHMRSFDGLDLVGHYFPGKNAKRLMILAHGWRGSYKGDFGMVARYLHERECDLLLIEQRAQRASEGEYMTFGILECIDILDWTDLMCKRTKLPIYLYGVSMGATAVEMAAGKRRMSSRVKGIIADCGFTSPYAILEKVARSMNPMLVSFVGSVNARCRTTLGCSLKEDSAVESLQHARVPVFFIHGEADSFVPVEMSLENYEACASRKHIILVEGADHGQSFVLESDRILQQMWNFFDWDECVGEQ